MHLFLHDGQPVGTGYAIGRIAQGLLAKGQGNGFGQAARLGVGEHGNAQVCLGPKDEGGVRAQ